MTCLLFSQTHSLLTLLKENEYFLKLCVLLSYFHCSKKTPKTSKPEIRNVLN